MIDPFPDGVVAHIAAFLTVQFQLRNTVDHLTGKMRLIGEKRIILKSHLNHRDGELLKPRPYITRNQPVFQHRIKQVSRNIQNSSLPLWQLLVFTILIPICKFRHQL